MTSLSIALFLLIKTTLAIEGPCDIFESGNTPCVAAHSTVRALFATYDGPLYQVRRSSDNTTLNISVTSTGGYADATSQVYCYSTSKICNIYIYNIYIQSRCTIYKYTQIAIKIG